MFSLPKPDKITVTVVILVFCTLCGYCFGKFYQPRQKTFKIYKQALKDYENKNYSNAYYLFSRVAFSSKLKPVAIYRQSLCAKSLGDESSELNNYEAFIKHYPNNPLITEVKYRAGQLLSESKSSQALKYFNDVSKSGKNSDYKIASEYYIAKINARSATAKPEDIEPAFRNYLKQYPDGRLAVDVAKTWQNYNSELSSADKALIAKAYILSGDNSKAKELLQSSDIKENWAINALLSKKLGNNAQLKDLVFQGVSKYSANVDSDDYKNAVQSYVKTESSYYSALSNLFSIAKGKNKDYIWMQKCRYAPFSEKLSCYNTLYANYPNSDYASEFMPNVVLYRFLSRDYLGAKDAAEIFITKYPESEHAPMVMFWRAKIEQQYTFNPNYEIFYKNIINNYPDNYYAYRSFWIINRFKNSVVNTELKYTPVEYPYKYPSRSDIMHSLLLVEDYDMIEKISDDEFVKSWVQYQKGKYYTSVHTARLAMQNLKQKPPKNDARWYLVYPMNYYKQVQKEAKEFGNNEALMMALIKEESAFNPEAQSSVGAVGLMQLMPSTAHDIGNRHGYYFDTTNLLNPELNIKIGNLYYSSLRKQLQNMDISAIASYNGGIGSVQRWKGNIIYNDTDEFVEQIPYDETRDYVKKVFGSYWNYIRIYQK